jgi:hypothetical protein
VGGSKKKKVGGVAFKIGAERAVAIRVATAVNRTVRLKPAMAKPIPRAFCPELKVSSLPTL